MSSSKILARCTAIAVVVGSVGTTVAPLGAAERRAALSVTVTVVENCEAVREGGAVELGTGCGTGAGLREMRSGSSSVAEPAGTAVTPASGQVASEEDGVRFLTVVY